MQGGVTHAAAPSADSLTALGWTAHFADQLEPAEAADLASMRIATVGRTKLTAETGAGAVRLFLPGRTLTTDFAVGDWVLVEPATLMLVRRLERQSLLQRKTATAPTQLIAANVDTLFIVTSCNDDFNLARLERYLALANEAGTTPVIVLTKVDQVEDPETYAREAAALQRDLAVVTVNAQVPGAAQTLAPWCGPGQTVALVGSSGVGKSTLLNTLSRKSAEEAQPTGAIREADAKGRHTTTARSLHAIHGGGWVIDTPGMRTLHVSEVADGLSILFAEITELAPQCRFRDCTHDHEPGCAVQAAVKAGTLDAARLERWRKLDDENRANTPTQTGPRGNRSVKAPGKRG